MEVRFEAVARVDVPERIHRLKDPTIRAEMMEKAKGSNLAAVAHFERYLIGEVYSAANQAVQGRMVGDYNSTSFLNGKAYPVFAVATNLLAQAISNRLGAQRVIA